MIVRLVNGPAAIRVVAGAIPQGGASAVSSVFGRTGAVVAVSGDYSAFYQVIDSGLTSLLAGDTTADTVPYVSGAGTWSYTGLTSFARSILDDVNAAAVRTTIDAQQLDADLTALAALASTGILARSATDTYSLRTVAAGEGIAVTNGDGVAGNPTIATLQTFVVLAADQSGITTEVAVTGLTFAPEAGKTYFIEVFGGFTTTATTTGFEHRMDPGNGTGTQLLASRGNTDSAGVVLYKHMDGSTRVLGTSSEGATNQVPWRQTVLWTAASSSPTGPQVYARAEAGGGGQSATVKAGTFLAYRKLN